ncbi:hypothetical protein KAX35_02175 [candidate division WOR-3 bacterium]|nr:hypothetical protein [candidate division WOR-3 bacterium]
MKNEIEKVKRVIEKYGLKPVRVGEKDYIVQTKGDSRQVGTSKRFILF